MKLNLDNIGNTDTAVLHYLESCKANPRKRRAHPDLDMLTTGNAGRAA